MFLNILLLAPLMQISAHSPYEIHTSAKKLFILKNRYEMMKCLKAGTPEIVCLRHLYNSDYFWWKYNLSTVKTV